MDLIEEIKEVVERLNNIENYCSLLNDKLSNEDLKAQDLLHLIEENKIGAFQCYRLIKELKKIRVTRRKIKNDIELSIVFNNNKNKLISKEYRSFLLAELNKRTKTLNQKYKNKYYQDCEIDKILKG